MRTRLAPLLAVSFVVLLAPADAAGPVPAHSAVPLQTRSVAQKLGHLPLSFEVNRGQAGSDVRFLARGSNYVLALTSARAIVRLEGAAGSARRVVSMGFTGADPNAEPAGVGRLTGVANYYVGNDPGRWLTDVPTYRSVEYRGLYRGVGLTFSGEQGQLEYRYVVSPYATAAPIRLTFGADERLSIERGGDLLVRVANASVRQQRPVAYQVVGGRTRLVAARFALLGGNAVGFALGAYERSTPLVIDPTLTYSTYLGGTNVDGGFGIAVDGSGSAYLTGKTGSLDFPTANGEQPALAGSDDAFVTKMTPAGAGLVYSTYLGGAGSDQAFGIALDGAGSAYITGETSSRRFPTLNAFQPTYGGSEDAFVTKLGPTGALAYSTYLGGTAQDLGRAITVDGSRNAYITGHTDSADFPTVNPFQPTNGGGQDGFVTELTQTGQTATFSTYLGGSGAVKIGGGTGDAGFGIAVDKTGIYVSGHTDSTDFPTVNAYQSTLAGGFDAFVAKFDPTGQSLIYSTFIGGTKDDLGRSFAIDSAGDAYITGRTASSNFPTVNAFQPQNNGSKECFVVKLAPAGNTLVYSSYLGGSSPDSAFGIAIDSTGAAFVTGREQSSDFPVLDPIQPTFGGVMDGFVTKVAPNGTLDWSTYLGGSRFDEQLAIAVDGTGAAYVTGRTASPDFPTMNPYQASNAGQYDAYVTKISS